LEEATSFPYNPPLDMISLGRYAPGPFTVFTGSYAVMANRLQLLSSQRANLVGTARLRVT
jgi:hypothetical protein